MIYWLLFFSWTGLNVLSGAVVGWFYRRRDGPISPPTWQCGLFAWVILQVLPMVVLGGLWMASFYFWFVQVFWLLMAVLGAAIGKGWVNDQRRVPATTPGVGLFDYTLLREVLNLLQFLYYLWKRPK